MKCPDCFEEVVIGEVNCPYCGGELDDTLSSEDDNRLESVATVVDEAEAYCIKDLLENHGIPAVIESYRLNNNGFSYDDDIWGEVFVAGSNVDLACSVVHKYTESTQRPNFLEELGAEDLEEEGSDLGEEGSEPENDDSINERADG